LVVIVLLGLAPLLMPGIETHREVSPRAWCLNNLHLIASALQAYHQANGCFPPAYIADKNGKPMHSWRVLILPYLDLPDLYKLYDFSQPWDGPKNKMVSDTPIMMYPCPSDPNGRASHFTQTSYVVVVGPNAASAGEKPRKLTDFGKDASHTIMLIEVTSSGIPWAEPRDLLLDTLGAANGKSLALALTSNHGRREEFFFTYDHATGVHVAMADGSVRFLRIGNRSIDDLRKLLQIGGFKEEEIGDLVRRLNWPNIAALAVWLLSVGALLTQAVRSRKTLPTSPAR
jgi:prepilin-type processing-associated H-X9-DG protein